MNAMQRIEPSARQVEKLDRQQAENEMDSRLLSFAVGKGAALQRWHVLRVASGHERDVAARLSAAGIPSYLPMQKVKLLVQNARKLRNVERPVWKDLLFIRVIPSPETWAGLARVKHVQGVMGGANGPVALLDREVERLMGLVRAGAFDTKKEEHGPVGSKVMIKTGPLDYREGVLEGYVGTRHVRVLADLFGGKVPIVLPLADVAKMV